MADEESREHTGDAAEGPELRLGVSSCLLGEKVRFDGGHKHSRYLTASLGRYVRFYPLCPEVEIGLGTPRPTIRLEQDPESDLPRLVEPRTGDDLSDRMRDWAAKKMAEIDEWDLHGYVLKKGSPSCGLFRVRVYADNGMPNRDGRGLFAEVLTKRFPMLPVEEEGRLNDPPLRESFIERLFIHERWKKMLAENPTSGGLVEFHTCHKLTLMAHSPDHYRRCGRLVADGKRPWEELRDEYAVTFNDGLRRLASRGRHTNVLQHVMGFVKNDLSPEGKAELIGLIEDYRLGLVPLVVPVTLLKHHLRRHDAPEWINKQVYLHPYPKELMLRNQI